MSEQQTERNRQVKTFEAPTEMIEVVQKVADERFEGNFSQAVRHLIRCGLAWTDDQGLSPVGRPVTDSPGDPSASRTLNPTTDAEIRQGGKSA